MQMPRKLSKNAAAELRALHEREGALHPETVVRVASDPESILHNLFCWDDTEAAHQFRLNQARHVISAAVTILPVYNKPVRAFVSLSSERKEGYRAIEYVLRDKRCRTLLLADALKEFQLFENKYKGLHELAGVFEAAAKVRKR